MATKRNLLNIKEAKRILKLLDFEYHEIESRIFQYKTLKDWIPITVEELSKMSDEEKEKLLSFCWHDGEVRCDTIGITDVLITQSESFPDSTECNLNWSDSNGDPYIYGIEMTDKIHNRGDGQWNYGLYKKKTKK